MSKTKKINFIVKQPTKLAIPEFTKEHNIKWFPIDLTITDNNGKLEKTLEYVDEYGCIPSSTDFKSLSNEEIIDRQKCVDKYNFIAIDTSVYHHIDIDMLDRKTYPAEQYDYIKDLIENKPYHKSISCKFGKSEGKHIFITTDYKIGKDREQTKFKDIEILSGQWGWVHKEKKIICPNNYMCKYNVESILVDSKQQVKPVIKQPIVNNVNNVVVDNEMVDNEMVDNEMVDNEKDNIYKQTNNYANLITLEYLDNYDDWFKIVMSLKSEGEQYKEIAKKISQKSSKFNNDEFNKIWSTTSKMTIATMYYYSKLSNKDRFLELKNNNERKFFLNHLSTNDCDIADIFINLNKDNLIHKNGDFYVYHNKSWIKQDNDFTMIQGLINKQLPNIYDKMDMVLSTEILETDDDDIKGTKRKKKDTIGKIIKMIKTSSGIKAISKSIKCKLSLMDFEHIEFDELPDILPFKSNIYDLVTHKFRDYKNTDYITMKINYDFEIPDKDVSNKFKELFNNIFPDEDIKRDYSRILSSVLFGRQSVDCFIIANGGGGNGKGVLNELMSEMLTSKFSYIAPVNVICNPIKQGSNPEVAAMDKKRLIIYSEPSKNDKIDIGAMKSLTGSNTINARMNHSNETTTRLNGIHILEANDKPKLNGKMDNSIKRRLIDIHFMSTFTGNKDLLNEEYHYPANDYYRTQEFKNIYKFALLDYLLTFIKDFQSNNETAVYDRLVDNMSQTTKNRTDKYIEKSDFFGSFLRDNIQKTGNNTDILKISDIYDTFRHSEEYEGLYKDEKLLYNGLKKFKTLVSSHILYKKLFKEKLNIKGGSSCVRNVLLGCKLIDEDE